MGCITELESAPPRVLVWIDDQRVLDVHRQVAARLGLVVGQGLTREDIERLQAADQLHRALAVARTYLGHKPRTVHDVQQRLRRADVDSRTVASVIEQLSAEGWLNDQSYAEDYARARFSHRKFGAARIRAELRRHGVADSHIQAALAALSGTVDFEAAAHLLAERHWARVQGRLPERRRKVEDYLCRRGYSRGLARTIVREIADHERD